MTLQANSNGVVTGKFLIPANVPAGSKRVVLTGSGGSHGESTFIGQGTTVVETRRVVTTVVPQRIDPLAETFTLDSAQQISGIDIWFTAAGTSAVEVQIRETSAGFPTQVILASARLAASGIKTNGNATRFDFTAPVSLNSDTEYAITVLCDDAVTACAIAELGKWDSVRSRWVTAQPYQVGVLLSSSNASTWTAHQDRDLTFQLIRANYSATTKTVVLGTVVVAGVTDLMIRANVENPSSNTGCEFQLTLPDGSTKLVASEQPVRLESAITGNVQVSALLRGSVQESPVLHRDVQLLTGTVASSGDYVSRAIAGGTNVKAKVILEAYLPGSSSLTINAKGIDAGDTWVNMSVLESVQMGDGWVELTYQSAAMTETMIHTQVILSGSVQYRPKVRNYRMLVS
jgi:hypothetical protein